MIDILMRGFAKLVRFPIMIHDSIAIAQWAFIAQNGMEIAPKSTVFSTIFNNGNL